jgi:hypothetical protein
VIDAGFNFFFYYGTICTPDELCHLEWHYSIRCTTPRIPKVEEGSEAGGWEEIGWRKGLERREWGIGCGGDKVKSTTREHNGREMLHDRVGLNM